MKQGWIQLHRSLLDSKVWIKHNATRVWIWCLLKANHKVNHVSWKTGIGSTVVTVQPGQFVTGRNSGHEETGLAASTWVDAMKFLQKEKMITLKPDTHYTLVTITNWKLYQEVLPHVQQATVPASDNQPTGTQHPSDTIKNEEKGKNDKKEEEAIYILQQFNQITGKSFKSRPENLNPIKERLAEGYEPNVLISVIEKKSHQWLRDDKMNRSLRPVTLFNKEKFENYVQESVLPKVDAGTLRSHETPSRVKRPKQYGKPFKDFIGGK